ncbi:MAG: 30S ribosomal protein S21 [Patescibacteria group bacterium]|nr:30S ribosomal protein S21 [Patescibacteria group bacterium]
MAIVKKRPGQTDEMLIRQFSREVINEGILLEVKRRQFHLKPSLARKMKKEEARRLKRNTY